MILEWNTRMAIKKLLDLGNFCAGYTPFESIVFKIGFRRVIIKLSHQAIKFGELILMQREGRVMEQYALIFNVGAKFSAAQTGDQDDNRPEYITAGE
jgi:hypothetical protein